MRLIGAGDLEFDGLRAGCEQQAVERELVAIAERHAARFRIDRGDARVEPEVDAGVLIKILAAQRQPVLRRIAGEIILGEVGTVDRHRAVTAEHGDGAGKSLAAKRLGRREAGRTAADDDEFLRRRRAAMGHRGFRRLALALDDDLVPIARDVPHRQRIQRRWSGRLARAK